MIEVLDRHEIHSRNGANKSTFAARLSERPMKILMTTDTMGGVWTYSIELTRALAERGHKISLATMGNPLDARQRQDVDQISGVEVFEGLYKLEWMDDPWSDVEQAGAWLLQLEGQVQPDLIHLNNYTQGALAWRAPKLVVGHSCVLSWWQAVKAEPAPQSWATYQDQVRRGLQGADLVLTPTEAMLSELVHHYGCLAHGKVIPNGRDPGLFSIDTKASFIFTASRIWDEAKNILALEAVAPCVPWPIYVAGDNQHPSGGDVQLNNIHSLGKLTFDELLPWFAQASIYALPARYEPFGLSALEAALAGCALVLGDIPSLREVWGDAAIYVPPNDLEALEIALVLLIIDPSYRNMMAARAYTRAQQFTLERMAASYVSVYQELIHQYEVA